GKTIGGDLVEGKKTYVFLTALERTTGKDRRLLQSLVLRNGITKAQIARAKEIYKRAGVLDAARDEIFRNTLLAQRGLSSFPISSAREMLHWLAHQLVGRNS
ncbi:MAG: polyprenyl synthetase family protein, partial [Ignavibacteriales bacterium]|nr:polyprenyl synthetase family protein [Ignavibacteriales bacterium]